MRYRDDNQRPLPSFDITVKQRLLTHSASQPLAMIETSRRLTAFMEEQWFQTLAQILSNVLLFFLVFGMSATVKIDQLRKQLNNKFAIFVGLAMQFIVMPLLGYLSVLLLMGNGGLTHSMAISLLIVTASPGGR